MKLIGLTGGIATGKSTVSALLAKAGAVIIDADALARKVVEKGQPAWGKVVTRFGRGILDSTGRIDRKRLGDLVFEDDAARADLEAIIHPEVFSRVQARLNAIQQRDPDALVVLDIPLLMESANRYAVDVVVVVYAPVAVQLARLSARDDLSDQAAMARIRSQMPIEEKAARADVVIDNSGDLERTGHQVDVFIRSL